MKKMKNDFASLIQNYFYENLINQRRLSQKTIISYRDTFRLFFKFAEKKNRKKAINFKLSDLTAEFIVEFLNYLEKERKNSIASRNARLAAIKSFMRYALYQVPEELPIIKKVLAIPIKRTDRPIVASLTREEITTIINSSDLNTWSGQRDQVLFSTMYNTGARVSEIIALKRKDVEFGKTMVVLLHGKGRKDRSIPLWKNTSHLIHKWLKVISNDPETPLFPNRFGKQMTSMGVENRLKIAHIKSSTTCVSLKNKRVSPHVFRHTTAMHLLQSGVDLTVISLWLGHESIETTHKYLHANIEAKKEILSKLDPVKHKSKQKIIPDKILSFLEAL